MRDDRPSGSAEPPAAWYAYSPGRSGEYAEQHLAGWRGALQADAFAGFNRLYAKKAGGFLHWASGRFAQY